MFKPEEKKKRFAFEEDIFIVENGPNVGGGCNLHRNNALRLETVSIFWLIKTHPQ